MTTPAAAPHPKLVLWVIWSAILAGVFFFRHFLAPAQSPGGSSPLGDNQAAMAAMLLGPTLLSLAIRLLWVPRAPDRGKQLVACIVGMALAESLTFYGIFLFPARADVFWGTSVVMLLAYVPLFVPARPPSTDAGKV